MCVLSDKIQAARMSTHRVNGRICRICFSPSFLPSSLPTTFLPPPFFPLHFFLPFYFSPPPSASLSFSNSLGLTFISATCSLRLGNTPVSPWLLFKTKWAPAMQGDFEEKEAGVSGKSISSICIKVWTFWEGRSDFLLQIQRTTEGQNALLCWHL